MIVKKIVTGLTVDFDDHEHRSAEWRPNARHCKCPVNAIDLRDGLRMHRTSTSSARAELAGAPWLPGDLLPCAP